MQRPSLSDEDGEVGELTADDVKLFRPIAEVDPGMVDAMTALRRRGGRPKLERPKIQKGFRLAADVVEGIVATGQGYNGRVERVLREALSSGKLDAGSQSSQPRKVRSTR